MYQVPFQRHPQMADIDARRLLRATLAADTLGQASEAVSAIFNAFWGTPAPLTTAADVVAVLREGGVRILATQLDDPALDKAVDEATEAAAARGVFGAPTMYVGDEMFFGNDRFDFIRASLERAA